MEKEINKEVNIVLYRRKKIVSFFVFVLISIISIITILSFNKSFSFSDFWLFIKNASFSWTFLSFVSVFFYIYFEGWSLVAICKSFGYKKRKIDGFFYSSADIYFSAITPSASGGQPASAYFMVKDGIPGPITTIALLYTLLMYSLSIVFVTTILFLIYPYLFFKFSFFAKLFIFIGYVVQVSLICLFYLLINKKVLLESLCTKTLNWLFKLHLIKHIEKKLEKLETIMNKYEEASLEIKKKKGIFFKLFLINLGQRFFQIATVVFVFLGTGGSLDKALIVGTIQSFVIMGAYCAPVPGAIGVTDYLMLDGFRNILSNNEALNLELLSRGISFYFCVFLCGIMVIVKFWLLKRSSKNDRSL